MSAHRSLIERLSTPSTVREQLAADVRTGLTAVPKVLPPKYFYDARGSRLFEAITQLPEYYLTRAETEILQERATEIVEAARPSELLELGSGSARKTRLLLEAMHRLGTGARYVPLDVSEDALRACAAALAADYPWLEVTGYVGDFQTDLARIPRRGCRLVTFLGSTIGNFDPEERARLLAGIARLLRRGDHFLLGVDLVKDPGTLEAAYDDAAGVTAAFNLNLLSVLNRELGANFPLDAFDHVAVFDKENSWVEMRLRARRALTVTFPTLGLEVTFAAGEELRTEISCKFTPEGVEQELAAAGLRLEAWFTDAGEQFGLALAAPREVHA